MMKRFFFYFLKWIILSLPSIPQTNRLRAMFYSVFGVNIGKGNTICRAVNLRGNVSTGMGCSFNENVYVASSGVGKIILGDNVIIGPNTVLRNSNHGIDRIDIPIRHQEKSIENIIIEDDVWIGSNVVILAGVHIGRGAVIGAGAVVSRNIPEYAVAVGVPARISRFRDGRLS